MVTESTLYMFKSCAKDLDVVNFFVRRVNRDNMVFDVKDEPWKELKRDEQNVKAVLGMMYALNNIYPVGFETWAFVRSAYEEYRRDLDEKGELKYILFPSKVSEDEDLYISPKFLNLDFGDDEEEIEDDEE